MGGMDDSSNPDQVKTSYLEPAVEAALAGKPPETAEAPAIGCRVRYARERRRTKQIGGLASAWHCSRAAWPSRIAVPVLVRAASRTSSLALESGLQTAEFHLTTAATVGYKSKQNQNSSSKFTQFPVEFSIRIRVLILRSRGGVCVSRTLQQRRVGQTDAPGPQPGDARAAAGRGRRARCRAGLRQRHGFRNRPPRQLVGRRDVRPLQRQGLAAGLPARAVLRAGDGHGRHGARPGALGRGLDRRDPRPRRCRFWCTSITRSAA